MLCVLYFWGIYCGTGLYFVTCLDTKHITWHMVPSSLYDHAKCALPGAPLPSNPSWSTVESRQAQSVYLTTLLLGRLSPLSTQLIRLPSNDNCPSWISRIESVTMEKYFMIKSPGKNVDDPVMVKPATSRSPVRQASNWATKANLLIDCVQRV